MSWQTGTATGMLDFLDKVDAFLCNQGHAWGKTYVGTGTGTLTSYLGTSSSVAETFLITAINATTFSVVGSVTGSLANATVGTPYTSAKVNFTLTAGGTAFIASDRFTLQTTPKWYRERYTGCHNGELMFGTNFRSDYPYTSLFDNGGGEAIAYTSNLPASGGIELFKSDSIAKIAFVGGSATADCPTSISLQYSDNNSSWTTLQTWSGITYLTTYERKTFTVSSPESHKYWRVAFNSVVSGSLLRVYELEFYTGVNNEYTADDQFEFLWRAPGLDGAKNIYVGGYTYFNTQSDIHNIAFYGFRYYDDKKSVTVQQGNSSLVSMLLNNQPFTYYIIANGQRTILLAMPSGSHCSAYLGFGVPYEPPSIHEYPCIIAGSARYASYSFLTTTTEHRAFFSPGYTLYAHYPDNAWRCHCNRYNSSYTSDGSGDDTNGKVFPWAYDVGGNLTSWLKEQIDGGFSLVPGQLIGANMIQHIWGEFDGVYHVAGINNSAGTILNYGGFDHYVTKNIARLGSQDFAALRLD